MKLKSKLVKQLCLYCEVKTKLNVIHDCLISQLRLEIITIIFHLCLPMQHAVLCECGSSWPEYMERRETNVRVLFTLGGVCKTWCKIIWLTPHLWSQIQIPIRPDDMQTTIEIAEDWLH